VTGHWIWWLAGGSIAVAAAALLAWALFWDQAKGRRRCPKCWYGMDGVPGLACPECGRTARGEPDFHHARRRWTHGAFAIALLCVAWSTALVGTPGRESGWAYVPTVALLAAGSEFDHATPAGRLIVDRLRAGVALPWDKWLARRIEAGRMPEDWSEAVRRRPKWPVGVPVRVDIYFQPWLGSAFDRREVSLWPRQSPAERTIAGQDPPGVFVCHFGGGGGREWIDLPPPALGANTYDLVMEVRAGAGAFITRRNISVPIDGVATIDEAMPPTQPAEHQRLVERLMFSVYQPECQVLAITFMENWRNHKAWGPVDHARRFRVTILQGGRPIGSGTPDPVWQGQTRVRVDPASQPWADLIDQAGETLDVSTLSVLIEPEPAMALIDLEFSRYSVEAFEVPVREVVFSPDGDTSAPETLWPTPRVPINGFKGALAPESDAVVDTASDPHSESAPPR
jgi:hypothetical protein